MARVSAGRSFSRVLEAGQHWKNVALLAHGSVFGANPIWSDENLDGLNQYFVDNLDWGEGDFLSKLERQLSQASPDVRKLAAEMLWVMQLCPSNVKPPAKRQLVSNVWSLSKDLLPLDSQWLQDDVLSGVGSAGTAFNTNR